MNEARQSKKKYFLILAIYKSPHTFSPNHP
jgi:hypothetical protein